jgi:hypothetical protein
MPTTLAAFGSDFQININNGGGNGINGAQEIPDLALLPDGRFVVGYQSNYFGSATDNEAIVAIFNPNGTASLGYNDVFNAGAHQMATAVAPRLNGGFGVTFQNARHVDNSVDANGPNITYRPVSASGALSASLAVADFNAGAGHDALQNPAIATLSSGRQVVAFERIWTNGTDHDVFLNVVNAAGTGVQFSIANPLDVRSNASWQANPAVAARGNKALVVFEDGTGTTTASANITARLFDGASNTLGAAVTIADHAGRLRTADVAALDDHRYAIVYGDQNDVWARVYDTSTASLSAEIQLDVAGGFALDPQVAAMPDSGFVATWAQWNGADYDVRARFYDGHLNAVGTDFVVTTTTAGSQFNPTVAVSDREIFFAWTEFGSKPGDTAPPSIGGRSFRIDDGDGNPLFESLYYLGQNPDVLNAGIDPLLHFNVAGWREGRDPNAFFDSSGYLAVNADVRAAGLNPLDHYNAAGWREGRDPSLSFDTQLYLVNNPDVAAAGMNPLFHYLAAGRAEGRAAYEAVGQSIQNGFDAQYYLFTNPDVAASGLDAQFHYYAVGWQEGRNPNRWFDSAGYLAHNGDVAAAGINPLTHYMQAGWRENRDPSLDFDTSAYLAANPDVAAAGINPLQHFLVAGIYEGRAPHADSVWD